MKIRIKGNSVRLRLTKTDIANFGINGIVTEITEFAGGAMFSYSIQKKEGIEHLEASYINNTVIVWVPIPISVEWVASEVIGFNNKSSVRDKKDLFILIEKDFVCLDHSFEDQSDNYPNPNIVC
ncbi:MAG: hypothetical protein WCJ85_08125 [Chitinophagaceae bacterium]